MFSQTCKSKWICMLRKALHDRRLDDAPRLKHVTRLVDSGLGNIGATIRDQLHDLFRTPVSKAPHEYANG
jgi:hypothetical protein